MRLQAGEDQGNAIAAAARDEVADGGGPGGVDHRHLAQAQDEHARRTAKGAQDIVDAIGHGEEQRAGDAVSLDAFRQGRALVGAWCSIEIVHIVFDQVDMRFEGDDLAHAVHEEEGRQHHADFHRHGQVHGHGEDEGDDQHHAIANG